MPTLILGSVPGRILRIQEIRPIAFVYGPGPRSPADLSVCPAGITLQVKHAPPRPRLWPLKIPCHVRFHRRAIRGAVRWYIYWLDGRLHEERPYRERSPAPLRGSAVMAVIFF